MLRRCPPERSESYLRSWGTGVGGVFAYVTQLSRLL